MDSAKYIGLDVHKESISIRGAEWGREERHGMRDRDQRHPDSAVFPRATGVKKGPPLGAMAPIRVSREIPRQRSHQLIKN